MTRHLMGLSCPVCQTSLCMPVESPAVDGDVFTCPACIAIIGLADGHTGALSEADLIQLRRNSPELVAQLEERRIALARHWAIEGHAPTLFGAVAAQMYATRGSRSLRLPGNDRCP